jgi:hypothetical protein
MGGSYAERKLLRLIQKLQQEVKDLELYVTSPPTIVIYNIQEIINETSEKWEQLVKNFLFSLHISPDWIIDVLNTTKSKNPESITVHLDSHCIKDKVFTIISNHFIKNNINALVTKEL